MTGLRPRDAGPLGLGSPTSERCIVATNSTNGTFRFHRIRAGELLNYPDLERYRDRIVVVDISAATPSQVTLGRTQPRRRAEPVLRQPMPCRRLISDVAAHTSRRLSAPAPASGGTPLQTACGATGPEQRSQCAEREQLRGWSAVGPQQPTVAPHFGVARPRRGGSSLGGWRTVAHAVVRSRLDVARRRGIVAG
jgi:hypothetical protein